MGSPRSRNADALPALEAAAKGRLKVLVDRVMPLGEAVAAHRLVETDPGIGKVILDPTLG